jgi:hypothetical protein
MKTQPNPIRVTVRRSDESIDIERWTERYVAVCLAALRPAVPITEAA